MLSLLFFASVSFACPNGSRNRCDPNYPNCHSSESCKWTPSYNRYCCTSNWTPSPPPSGYCPWMTSSGQPDVLVCNDGHRCNGNYNGWDCCARRGGRRQCPSNTPIMCNAMTCGGGHDYCCASRHCDGNLGGKRQCDSGNNVVRSEGAPTLGAMAASDGTKTAQSRVQAAEQRLKKGAQDFKTAHPHAKENVQKGVQSAAKGVHDFAASHPDATHKVQAGVDKLHHGVQTWSAAHPDAKKHAQEGVQRMVDGAKDWRAAHPDVTIESLIDQLVEFMTPERKAKAKNMLTMVVDLLMETMDDVAHTMKDMKQKMESSGK